MITVSVQDIQRDPLGYIRQVENGETVLVLRDAKLIAEIKPANHQVSQPRPFGLCAGQFTAPADFDQPLPVDVLKDFEAQ